MNKVKVKRTRFECGHVGFTPKDHDDNMEKLFTVVNKLINDRNNLIRRVIDLERVIRENKT